MALQPVKVRLRRMLRSVEYGSLIMVILILVLGVNTAPGASPTEEALADAAATDDLILWAIVNQISKKEQQRKHKYHYDRSLRHRRAEHWDSDHFRELFRFTRPQFRKLLTAMRFPEWMEGREKPDRHGYCRKYRFTAEEGLLLYLYQCALHVLLSHSHILVAGYTTPAPLV